MRSAQPRRQQLSIETSEKNLAKRNGLRSDTHRLRGRAVKLISLMQCLFGTVISLSQTLITHIFVAAHIRARRFMRSLAQKSHTSYSPDPGVLSLFTCTNWFNYEPASVWFVLYSHHRLVVQMMSKFLTIKYTAFSFDSTCLWRS